MSKGIDVSRRSKLAGWLIIGATFVIPALFVPVEELPRAAIGLAGHLDSPVDRPVTLTAQLPRGYGLSASERRGDWPELNEQHLAQAILDEPAFEIQLPPARYCIHRFWWQETPPPPLWLTLRFSDAPSEEYVVWATAGGSDYVVRSADGTAQPKTRASWRLHLGTYRLRDADAADPTWLLDVRLEHLTPPTPPGGAELARAFQAIGRSLA